MQRTGRLAETGCGYKDTLADHAGRIGTKSFDLSYALFVKTKEGRKLCTQGRSVMVCFDYAASGSIALPDSWRVALARMMENDV